MLRAHGTRSSRHSAFDTHSSSGQSLVEFALVVPLLVMFLVAVADLARIYTTMTAIESAAREAADYGAFDSQLWTNPDKVRADMKRRACTAAMDLPDYVEPSGAAGSDCTNPEVIEADWVQTTSPDGLPCTDRTRAIPCQVRVELEYDFRMLVPVNVQLFDVSYGFPSQLTFRRVAIFAMSDLSLQTPPPDLPSGGPGPDPTPGELPSEEPSPSAEPSASGSPLTSPEPSASASEVVTPSPSSEPPATPEPTPTPQRTPTPEPTPTPTPTPEPTPTPDPTPSASPSVTTP